MRIDDCEAGTVARIRKPVDKEPLKECVQKTADQKVHQKFITILITLHYHIEDHQETGTTSLYTLFTTTWIRILRG